MPTAAMPAPYDRLPDPGRFPYLPITRRPAGRWPNGAGLAVYLGFNLEHFAFGEGLGAGIAPPSPQPDVLNFAWREYGNRVGAWRCLELFERLALPTGTLLNSALYDHCPELVAAFQARGDELIAHGHSNAVRQSDLSQDDERQLLRHCRERIARESGVTPAGWLSPWLSETRATPDLLAETGYRYTLNWGHDDQPVRMQTTHGTLWSIPYSQEANDIPMIMHRQMDGRDFSRLIIDQFDEMLDQSRQQPLVLGLALHPYIIGQPHRLRHLRSALEHIAAARDANKIWMTTPGAICRHVSALGLD